MGTMKPNWETHPLDWNELQSVTRASIEARRIPLAKGNPKESENRFQLDGTSGPCLARIDPAEACLKNRLSRRIDLRSVHDA